MDTRFSILKAGWVTLPINEVIKAKQAMGEYRKENPVCEITGSSKKCQVHHIIPVWKAPELAADKNNMITLSTCANIHMIFGHAGNFQKRYVSNVKDIASKVVALRQEFDTVHRNENVIQEQSSASISHVKGLFVKILFKMFRS